MGLRADWDYATQVNAPIDLRFVSQPRGMPQLDNFPNYVYKKAKYRHYIYVLGLGLEPDSRDFHGRNIEWVYTQAARYVRRDTETENSPSWHDMACASKAAGRSYGVAKEATIVVVKMPDRSFSSILEVIGTTIRHIRRHGRGGKSVVMIPFGSKGGGTRLFFGLDSCQGYIGRNSLPGCRYWLRRWE